MNRISHLIRHFKSTLNTIECIDGEKRPGRYFEHAQKDLFSLFYYKMKAFALFSTLKRKHLLSFLL